MIMKMKLTTIQIPRVIRIGCLGHQRGDIRGGIRLRRRPIRQTLRGYCEAKETSGTRRRSTVVDNENGDADRQCNDYEDYSGGFDYGDDDDDSYGNYDGSDLDRPDNGDRGNRSNVDFATGEKKLDAWSSGLDEKSNIVGFRQLSKAKEEYEVCRLFLSTLMLCNCGNVIIHDDNDISSTESLQIELLKSKFEELMDEFLAPSVQDDNGLPGTELNMSREDDDSNGLE